MQVMALPAGQPSAICTDKLLASWTEMQHTAHGDNRLRYLSYMDVAISRQLLPKLHLTSDSGRIAGATPPFFRVLTGSGRR